MDIVIFDKNTKEVIACIDLANGENILRKDMDYKIFDKTEPVFIEGDGIITLSENSFILKNIGKSENDAGVVSSEEAIDYFEKAISSIEKWDDMSEQDKNRMQSYYVMAITAIQSVENGIAYGNED